MKPMSSSGCCPHCGKVLRANAKAVACDYCDVFVHIKCGNVAQKLHDEAVRNKADISLVCNRCCVWEMCSADVPDDSIQGRIYDEDCMDERDCDPLGPLSRKGMHFITITSEAAVIAVSETWLDNSVQDGEVGLSGYFTYRRDCNRHGGGVCLFICSDITFNPCHDLQVDGPESACVEVILPRTKPIIVRVCYHPPKQTDFYELLESVCCKTNYV